VKSEKSETEDSQIRMERGKLNIGTVPREEMTLHGGGRSIRRLRGNQLREERAVGVDMCVFSHTWSIIPLEVPTRTENPGKKRKRVKRCKPCLGGEAWTGEGGNSSYRR